MKLAGLPLDKDVASEDSTELNNLDFSEESEGKIVVTCELSPDSEAVVKVFLNGVTSNGPKPLLILSDLLLYATCIGVENKGRRFFLLYPVSAGNRILLLGLSQNFGTKKPEGTIQFSWKLFRFRWMKIPLNLPFAKRCL